MNKEVAMADGIGIDIDAFFSLIKKNHGAYLRDHMIADSEEIHNIKQARLLKDYIDNLSYYRSSKENYLNLAIRQIPSNYNNKKSALSALLNMGINKIAPSTLNELKLPIPAQDNESAFTQILKTGITYIAAEEWEKLTKQSLLGDDLKQFQEALSNAGFHHQKYQLLSIELIKLFHFRESVLLGFVDHLGINLREDFIAKYLKGEKNKAITPALLNKAIDLYFKQELNKLFNKAFADIYEDKEEKIAQEKEQTKFYTWLKNFFEKPEARYQFSQQLQIHFMTECINFLQLEKNQPSFIANHPYLTTVITGFIAGFSLSLITAIFSTNIALLIAIGLVSACIVASFFYWLTHKANYFKYKRNASNREAISNTIEYVDKECTRLRQILNTPETSPEDIGFLDKYNDRNNTKGLLKFSNKQAAMGSFRAWLREHASRYRHSKGIEIDLEKQHRAIIGQSYEQTMKLQTKLLEVVNSKLSFKYSKNLSLFITNTRDFLLDPANKEFAVKFELIEKIKEQILEIIKVVPPPPYAHRNLPENLVKLYTDSTIDGGLGGHVEDLTKVRELAPGSKEGNVSTPPSFHELLRCAQRLNYHLTQDANYLTLFQGDREYREKLGLPINHLNDTRKLQLNPSNIKEYLRNSYHFLYSLNPEIKSNSELKLDSPINNSNEFVLYRMLLTKQLAILTDPNNPRIDLALKQEIYNFMRDYLFLDPNLVFDDIINQTLFDKSNDIEFMAHTLRMHLAYTSKPITPKMLLHREAKEFISDLEENGMILCQDESERYLVPESSAKYTTKLKETLSNTKEFISYLNKNKTLRNAGCYYLYMGACLQEIHKMEESITSLTKVLRGNDRNFNSLFLIDSQNALKLMKTWLKDNLPLEKNLYSPDIRPKKYRRLHLNREQSTSDEHKSDLHFFHRQTSSFVSGPLHNSSVNRAVHLNG